MFFKSIKEKLDNRWIKVLMEVLLASIAFVLPFLLMLFISLSNKIYPFGNNTIMMIDMQSQYISYMRYYKSLLNGDSSMIYSLSKVFGGDFISIYAYYLASPFNLFVAFCPYSEIPAFFLCTNIIKIGFSGLNMYLCLRIISKHKSISHYIMSVGYGLISYSIVYFSNFMWLDGVMILPLVVLGIEKLKEGKWLWLYPISLAYSLFTSWYIGALICMFSIFYFFYSFFSMKENFKSRIPFLIRFILFSIGGGFIAGIIWVSAFLHLSGTKATSSFGSFMTYPFQMIIAGFLENSYTSTSVIAQNYGYAAMFTGVVSLVLFQLFFLNNKIPLRERVSALCLFSFYIFFSTLSITYTLLHGGREPTWFPTRYSFAIGFIVCFFGAKEIDNFEYTPVYASFFPIIIGIGSTLYLKFTTYNVTYNSPGKYNISIVSLIIYYATTLLVLAYTILNDLKPKLNKTLVKESFAFILAILSSISSYRGANVVFKNNVNTYALQNINTYKKDDMYTSDFELVKSLEKDKTYRMEATFNRPGNYNEINNNPMFYSYNGLSHFSSSELKDVENFMLNLGFHYNGFFEKYNAGSTVAINSFLNIKYIIDNEKDHSTKPIFIKQNPYENLNLASKNNGINFYINKYALPFGMVTSKLEGERIKDYDILLDYVKWYDHFEYQNSLFKMLCNNVIDEDGKQKDIFKKVETLSLKTSDELNFETRADKLNYYTGPAGSKITIQYQVPSDITNYNLYFCEKNLSESVSYTMDNFSVTISNYWDKGIKPIKETSNRKHILEMTLKNNLNSSYLLDEFYYEDLDVLKEYIDEIRKQGTSNIKEIKGSLSYGFEGDYLINKDNQYILFTLPYEKNMHIYIDNKEVPTEKKLNIFTGADLSKISKGTHKIKILYVDNSIKCGTSISILGLLMVGSGSFFYIKIENIVITKFKERRKDNEQD